MEFKVKKITDDLLNIYKKFAKENYYIYYYRKFCELESFLDTLTGIEAFELGENSKTYGGTDYFLYDNWESELNFYSTENVLNDMNNDKDFIKYLIKIGYFEKNHV